MAYWRVPPHFQTHHHVKLIRAGNYRASDVQKNN